MSQSYNITDQFATYFTTFQVVNWVDVFTRKIFKDIIVDALNYCIQHKNLEVNGWCLMSNHLHLLIHSPNGTLSSTIRDLKRYTSMQIFEKMNSAKESRRNWMLEIFRNSAKQHSRNTKFQVWTHENHSELLNPFNSGMTNAKLNYLHENPVRAGIVENAKDYLYSSAKDYEGRSGLVKIVFV